MGNALANLSQGYILTRPEHLRSMSAIERQQKESAIVAAFRVALDDAKRDVSDVSARMQAIEDARTLKAMARSIKASEETLHIVAIGTVKLLRAFGLAVIAAGDEHLPPLQLQHRTGLVSFQCIAAIKLAKYSEQELDEAMDAMIKEGSAVNGKSVANYLIQNDPQLHVRAPEIAERERKKREESEKADVRASEWEERFVRENEDDARREHPDFDEIMGIAREFGYRHYVGAAWHVWPLLVEIQRLRAQLAAVKTEAA